MTPSWIRMSAPGLHEGEFVFEMTLSRWCWLRPSFWRMTRTRLHVSHPVESTQTESGYMPGWQDPLAHVRGWRIEDNELENNREPTQTEKED